MKVYMELIMGNGGSLHYITGDINLLLVPQHLLIHCVVPADTICTVTIK